MGIRIAITWELCCIAQPGGRVTLRGDVVGAYLTARLSAPPTYLRLAGLKNLPKIFTEHAACVIDPCVRLEGSVYGL